LRTGAGIVSAGGLERKTMPVADVMAAGGWEDYRTFLQSYNRADEKPRGASWPFKQRAEVEAHAHAKAHRRG
jgi:hypothetical protein